MTQNTQAVDFVAADRFAFIAARSANAAALAAKGARRNFHACNLTADLARAPKPKTGRYVPLIAAGMPENPDHGWNASSSIASTARYTAVAGDAARYAAAAAEAAGATRPARSAYFAARQAASWAGTAQRAADRGDHAPFTALMAAAAARNAALAARKAANAAAPLGVCATRTVNLAVAVLPPGARDRYREEWKSDLCYLEERLQRARQVSNMLVAAGRMAFVLRYPSVRS
jgi:hypothetical protein